MKADLKSFYKYLFKCFFYKYNFPERPKLSLKMPSGNLRLLKFRLERSLKNSPDGTGKSAKQIAFNDFINNDIRYNIKRIEKKLSLDLTCDNLFYDKHSIL